MSGRHTGMIEVVVGIPGHSQPLHHPDRRQVDRNRERDYLSQSHTAEGVGGCCACGLGGVTASPEITVEAPPDLHRGHEVRFEARDGKADVADEWRDRKSTR